MNIKEWRKACDEGWAPRKYDNASREIQRSLKYNSNPNATVRHHLRDTEEQRKYNDEHYELWGFEIDESGNEHFEYGKYIIFCTDEEHHSVWHNVNGENNPMYGKPGTNLGKTFSEEHRKRISESRIGHEVSDETREKISDTLKNSDKHPWRGKQLPDYVKQKISDTKKNSYHPYRGGHLSEEHRTNIGESLKGHSTSDETKSKISESLKGHAVSEETRHKLSMNSARAMLGKSHSDETKRLLREKKQLKISLYNRYKSLGGCLMWNDFQHYITEIYDNDTDSFDLEFKV